MCVGGLGGGGVYVHLCLHCGGNIVRRGGIGNVRGRMWLVVCLSVVAVWVLALALVFGVSVFCVGCERKGVGLWWLLWAWIWR